MSRKIKACLLLLPIFTVFCAPLSASVRGFGGDILQGDTPLPSPNSIAERSLAMSRPREVSFQTTTGTWMSLDVAASGQTIIFDLLGDLYELPIGGGVARPLTRGTAWDTQPVFSPDGTKILFLSDRSGSREVWVMNADGRNPRQVSQQSAVRQAHQEIEYSVANWSADGERIYAVFHPIESARSRIAEFGVAGDFRQVMDLGDMTLGQPEPSAVGGVYVGTQEGSPSHYVNRVVRVDPDGSRSIVSREGESAFKPRLSPDGRFLAYIVRDGSLTNLIVQDLRTGSRRIAATGLPGDLGWSIGRTIDAYPGYSFVPDGRSIMLTAGGEIWRVDLSSGVRSRIPFRVDVSRLLSPLLHFQRSEREASVTVRQLQHPTFSADGRFVAFGALRRVWVHDTSNMQTLPVSDGDAAFDYPTWAGGNRLLFTRWDGDRGAIVQASINGRCLVSGDCPQRVFGLRDSPYDGLLTRTDQNEFTASVRGLANGGRERTYLTFSLGGADHPPEARSSPPPSSRRHVSLNGESRITDTSPDARWVLFHSYYGRDGFVVIRRSGDDDADWAQTRKGGGALVPFPLRADSVRWDSDSAGITFSVGHSVWHARFNADGETFGEPTRLDIQLTQRRDYGDGTIVFRNARLLTMGPDAVIENGDLIVVDGVITFAGRHGAAPYPANARVLDMSGRTILPGYVDLHAHVGRPQALSTEVDELPAYLAYGVTSIRDPQPEIRAGITSDFMDYEDRVRIGDLIGPRYFSTGPSIRQNFRGLDSQIDTLAALAPFSREFNDSGTLKQYETGSRARRQWIASAASHLRLMPTNEGNLADGMTFVVDGYSGMEHSYNFPGPAYRDVVEFVARSGIVYTPTLAVMARQYFLNQVALAEEPRLRRLIRPEELARMTAPRVRLGGEDHFVEAARDAHQIFRAGGRIGVGSHGDFPGIEYHFELWALVLGGFSPLEALHCATVTGAFALGLEHELGTLEAGKLADLQILDRNPVDDIRNTDSVRYVMRAGRLYNAETLDQLWPIQREFRPRWANGQPSTPR